MWLLSRSQLVWHLPVKADASTYRLGRKAELDIVVDDDVSISREHCEFRRRGVQLFVVDRSKFGTYVGAERLNTGQEKELHTGDDLQFGARSFTLHVEHRPVVLKVSFADTAFERFITASLGLALTDDAAKCTHFVVENVAVQSPVSVELLLALCRGARIVQRRWVDALAVPRASLLQPLPAEENYWPTFEQYSAAAAGGGGVSSMKGAGDRSGLLKGWNLVFAVKGSPYMRVAQLLGAHVSDDVGALRAKGAHQLRPSWYFVMPFVSDMKGNAVVQGSLASLQELGLSFISYADIEACVINAQTPPKPQPVGSLPSSAPSEEPHEATVVAKVTPTKKATASSTPVATAAAVSSAGEPEPKRSKSESSSEQRNNFKAFKNKGKKVSSTKVTEFY